MRTANFNFQLPQHLIAQHPPPARDSSRLLVLNRSTGQISHCTRFRNLLEHLRPNDLLVLNDSRVLPARLRGRKALSGGEIEVLLVEEVARNQWWALLRPGKRVRTGTKISFGPETGPAAVKAVVLEKNSEGHCRLEFALGSEDITARLHELGEVPLPPYINRPPGAEDRERYQTVYGRAPGSVAAPTAGLHFTPELLAEIRRLGVEIRQVTLHVGLGTFAPVKTPAVESHLMHEERFILSAETAASVNRARESGRRVVAVGTTTVRVLESVARESDGRLVATEGRTRIFIYPPFEFKVVDALLTNFHLPQSTLLMLVSAFAAPGQTRGRDLILRAYEEAVRNGYRFFSYGDAMLIVDDR
jgi:S-adenosylmethionine:tRNA ribosyltransferase-isomerase